MTPKHPDETTGRTMPERVLELRQIALKQARTIADLRRALYEMEMGTYEMEVDYHRLQRAFVQAQGRLKEMQP